MGSGGSTEKKKRASESEKKYEADEKDAFASGTESMDVSTKPRRLKKAATRARLEESCNLRTFFGMFERSTSPRPPDPPAEQVTPTTEVRPCDHCGEMRKTTNFFRGEESQWLCAACQLTNGGLAFGARSKQKRLGAAQTLKPQPTDDGSPGRRAKLTRASTANLGGKLKAPDSSLRQVSLAMQLPLQDAMADTKPRKKITAAELAQHSTDSNAWMACHGLVLNLSKEFLEEHPGGPDVDFEDISHSDSAREWANKLIIGYMKGTEEEESERKVKIVPKHAEDSDNWKEAAVEEDLGFAETKQDPVEIDSPKTMPSKKALEKNIVENEEAQKVPPLPQRTLPGGFTVGERAVTLISREAQNQSLLMELGQEGNIVGAVEQRCGGDVDLRLLVQFPRGVSWNYWHGLAELGEEQARLSRLNACFQVRSLQRGGRGRRRDALDD
eukprot:g19395.t1